MLIGVAVTLVIIHQRILFPVKVVGLYIQNVILLYSRYIVSLGQLY